MNMPGFTAEDSVYRTSERYRMVRASGTQYLPAQVQPALPKICHVLAELVWGAYNEGAYNRGEFWLNVMERAGCFN